MSAAGEAEPPALDSQRGRIGRLLRSPLLAQGAGFAGSQAAVMLLAAVSTVLVARGLSTQGFGSQAFAVSFLTFTAMFFDFGIALPVARLTAARPQSGRRQMVGTGLLVFVPIGVLFSAAVFGLSFFVDSWFHAHVAGALRLIAAVAFVYPFAPLGNYLAQATDRLHTYSVTSVASQALYVAAVAVVIAAGVKLSVALVLELRLAGMLVSSVALVAWLSPQLRGCAAQVREVLRAAREYGLQAYIGRVLSMATYSMDVIMLGALTNAKTVGFYSLAGSAAYAVALPVLGMSAALFPRMITAKRVDHRWLAFSWISGLACAGAVVVLAHPLLPAVFGRRYAPAIGLIAPLALAQAVVGVTTVYNTFLSAQGQGKPLRNTALVLTGSNLILNFALIPPFGALGAAWASLGALVANLGAHVVFYRRAIGSQRTAADRTRLAKRGANVRLVHTIDPAPGPENQGRPFAGRPERWPTRSARGET